jgi:transposase InsO family protein
VLRRPIEFGQYTSIAVTERLAAAGAPPSIGTVGDAFDNALAESQIGLFKTEVICPRAPWKGLDDVELAVLEWVDWHNHRRLHRRLLRPATGGVRTDLLRSTPSPTTGWSLNYLLRPEKVGRAPFVDVG